jgi:hypothetical protein
VSFGVDPLQLTPWDVLRHYERGRWDDTQDEYRVLYCASSAVGAFVEVLQGLNAPPAQSIGSSPRPIIFGALMGSVTVRTYEREVPPIVKASQQLAPGEVGSIDPDEVAVTITRKWARSCCMRC